MKRTQVGVFVFLGILLALTLSTFLPFPREKLQPAPVISLRLTDRHGLLLREVLSDEEGRCRWINLRQVSPAVIKATLAAEDKNFFFHGGIDPLALLRAGYQNLKSGQIISGGSTITQQVVRNIYHFPRNLFWKGVEMWLALRLEHSLSKEEILTQYLNRIFYGHLAYGIEAAARLYFDKPAAHLSLAEAAFLAALPRSPVLLNPYQNFHQVKKQQLVILRRLLRSKMITPEEYQQARQQPLNLVPEKYHFRAPHFTRRLLALIPAEKKRNISLIQTTLDYFLQQKIELLLQNHLKTIEKHRVTNGAVIVLNNQTGEVLAYVGSADFFDSHHSGQIDGVLALRQPGSTLKPFTYALALEQGLTAADLIPDIETHLSTAGGDYSPRNYDGQFHGPVRLRTALACSYNVPAVRLVAQFGAELLLDRLHRLGFQSLREKPSYYGVGLTLGNGEVTLLELTRAYAALARGGLTLREKLSQRVLDNTGREITIQKFSPPRRVFSPQISYIVTHILSDNTARAPAFGYGSPLHLPFPCAAKTGTSKDFRDNWTIGFTPEYTVGVWVGNFDGRPMNNVSGITGCGPLFRDIMLLLEERGSGGDFNEPPGLVKVSICPLSGRRPNPSCPGKIEEIFLQGTEPPPEKTCDFHQLVRVDKETGQPVDEAWPADKVVEKIQVVYPPLYHQWAIRARKISLNSFNLSSVRAEARRLHQTTTADKPEDGSLHSSNRGENQLNDLIPASSSPGESHRQYLEKMVSRTQPIKIIFPDEGDIFKIDPVLRPEFQTIPLQVMVTAGLKIKLLKWYVDDRPYAQINYPSEIRWSLKPGRHTFQVVAQTDKNKIKSDPVTIEVVF